MTIFLHLIYFAVCLILIVIVLLQHGKGADIGVSLGSGASNTVFGARGAGNFLTKLTTGSAILFMILAFSLARCSPETTSTDLLSAPASPAKEAPKSEAPATSGPESAAPPSEPGAPPSGFEAVEPPKPSEAPAPPAPPAKPPS
ncbi:MAG: preprotein translocase subunit SecG [Myxococcota bacterium]